MLIYNFEVFLDEISVIQTAESNELPVVRKAESSLNSGHVTQIFFDGSLGIIKGRVLASLKNKTYNVQITMKDGNIESYTCECPRGRFKCHHIAAVMLYAQQNISKTDTICQWKAPTASTSSSEGAGTSASINELFPLKKSRYQALNRQVDEEDKTFLFNKLKTFNRFTAFYWLLSPEPTVVPQENIKSFSTILNMAKTETGGLIKERVLETFKSNREEILFVVEATKGQNENAVWHQMRLGRLTASNFGIVLDACRRERYPPSLYSRLLGKTNLEGVKSIQWGLTHEGTAINVFEQIEGKVVNSTGLWLHECGFLGASPDGLVDEDAIIEIKCPFSHRSSSMDKIRNDKKYCLDENLNLKQTHVYYHQIQGTLHLTGRSLCYFVVWTPTLYIKVDVYKDLNWSPNLNVLENFYENNLLGKLLV